MSALAPILFVLLLPLSLFKVVDSLMFKSMPPHLEAGFASATLISPVPSPTPTPTPTQTPAPSPLPQGPSAPLPTKPPSQISLSDWKLTLPTGSAGHPAEVRQPELAQFSAEPWFTPLKEGIRFRAPVDGVTTSGSKYPRSELREMSAGGKTNAAWSTTAGSHTLVLEQAITAVPQAKKHVVAGQIHDSDDDILVVRLEYPKLYINVDGKNQYLLDENYSLGKRFSVKLEVAGGETKVYYNGSANPVYTLNKNYSGAYFKAGAYTQSNCSKEELCGPANFGEVVLYSAAVSHQS